MLVVRRYIWSCGVDRAHRRALLDVCSRFSNHHFGCFLARILKGTRGDAAAQKPAGKPGNFRRVLDDCDVAFEEFKGGH
jgi:hypothetical protein